MTDEKIKEICNSFRLQSEINDQFIENIILILKTQETQIETFRNFKKIVFISNLCLSISILILVLRLSLLK